jgi:hopanoid-associated phosphorylase
MSGSIIAVTSLALEARIALGSGVSVICSQGPHLAAVLEKAVQAGALGIISFGVAGGLAPDLATGEWIAAAGVRAGRQFFSTDREWTQSLVDKLPSVVQADILGMDSPVADPREKRLLHTQTGAAAVDMESHIAAEIAAAHRIPFAACRVIIDPAHRRLPPAALIGLRQDGTADLLAVLRSVMQQPGQMPALMRTALDAGIARTALRCGRRMLGPGLGFPRFHDNASETRLKPRQNSSYGRPQPESLSLPNASSVREAQTTLHNTHRAQACNS